MIQTLPECIDDLPWQDIAKHISRLKPLTRDQRESLYSSVLNAHPCLFPKREKIQRLTENFFCCREFHTVAALPYHDPKKENGQLIRIALTQYFARQS